MRGREIQTNMFNTLKANNLLNLTRTRLINAAYLCDKKESPLKNLLDNAASFEDAKNTNPVQQWTTTPYADGVKIQKQEELQKRNKKDPRDTSIILFPGQGTQYVGMAKDLLKFPMAKELFNLANYVLEYDLLKLCLEGPKNKLEETKYCQPAVMVTSLATLEKLKEERPNAIENCIGTAGFSLGEITALVFAGALEFERGLSHNYNLIYFLITTNCVLALKLVTVRAQSMQLACEMYKGAMATVMYGPDSNLNFAVKRAKEWALEKGVEKAECKVSTYLYPHCKVVAGNVEAIEYLEKNLKEYKLRKVKRLPVSGAFHSDLMEPAVAPFKRALWKSEIQDPIIKVYSNVDGKAYRDAGHIRHQLPKQVRLIHH